MPLDQGPVEVKPRLLRRGLIFLALFKIVLPPFQNLPLECQSTLIFNSKPPESIPVAIFFADSRRIAPLTVEDEAVSQRSVYFFGTVLMDADSMAKQLFL
ncbi:hypothetical protein QTH97_10105 [Variovorax sp. J22R24]|uniref:hypothetical protein n=1 Tax=Variovorax gracilis TaxID=3053502 RepID=UPI002574DC93|nr:hypothetical protein [Variovorax sp. J22R24]MDM0105285.1 hypothetical protein [Variovorax sp. J22R24]